jgi:hypothetical protein
MTSPHDAVNSMNKPRPMVPATDCTPHVFWPAGSSGPRAFGSLMIHERMPDSRTAPPLPPYPRRGWPLSPFVTVQLVAAPIVGAIAGAFMNLSATMSLASAMFGGAAVSAALSRYAWPRSDDSGWKLALVATFGNPLFLFALYAVVDTWCGLGRARDIRTCFVSGYAFGLALLCLVPVCTAFLWRWWKSRRTPPNVGP